MLNSIADGKMYWVKTDGQPCEKHEQAQNEDIVSILYSGESAEGKLTRFNHWSVCRYITLLHNHQTKYIVIILTEYIDVLIRGVAIGVISGA